MSKSIKSFVVLGFVALVAACSGQQEEEVVIVEPIQPDPVSTKF